MGKPYAFIIDKPHRWPSWAAPKKADGSFDHGKALTGDDLIACVNNDLCPYLKSFKERAAHPDTIEYKIGEIFSEIRNRFESGYNLRDALELIDGLRFRSQKEKHELSHLYEAKIKNIGNAGRNGGEYYTPRPLIRAMIAVTKPKTGERIYDGALGSAGCNAPGPNRTKRLHGIFVRAPVCSARIESPALAGRGSSHPNSRDGAKPRLPAFRGARS